MDKKMLLNPNPNHNHNNHHHHQQLPPPHQKCNENQFICTNGECISKEHVWYDFFCNKFFFALLYFDFALLYYFDFFVWKKIPVWKFSSDKDIDCSDESDERQQKNCQCKTSDEFHCQNGFCILKIYRYIIFIIFIDNLSIH